MSQFDALSKMLNDLSLMSRTMSSRMQAQLPVNASSTSPMSTTLPTIISHTHGRERRVERNIDKKELQEAVKYGKKERANPSRTGQIRHKFTHKGVIYITDETGRHEITSWRMDEAEQAIEHAELSEGACSGSHTIIVVDSSGSMRKEDVPGYKNRTEAVYDCIARDFLEPQLQQQDKAEHMVSLLEMSDTSNVIFKRAPISDNMKTVIKQRGKSFAKSHGNYLPMLEAVMDLLLPEMNQARQLFIIILSDGAPSDHTERVCEHGIPVWQPDCAGGVLKNGKPVLQKCRSGIKCRQNVVEQVRKECLQKVTRMGDLYGRDRVSVSTVAFGPPSEDFETLQMMAKVLPRGSFQKLGLSADALRTAFSSLTSSLTSLRSDAAGCSGLTERKIFMEKNGDVGSGGWDIYPIVSSLLMCADFTCFQKERWNIDKKVMETAPYDKGSKKVAHAKNIFGKGAERQVYHFYEVDELNRPTSILLTAKQPAHNENMEEDKFMKNFCRVQAEAQWYATNFNRRVNGKSSWQVNFVDCVLYDIKDSNIWTKKGHGHVLAEPFLEGKFQKWNNNGGGVKKVNQDDLNLGVIGEDDEQDDEESSFAGEGILPYHIPQAFSHFTYVSSARRKLVCDLQGVWNQFDGYVLTDPVIHHITGKGKNGRTDKGASGMSRFFDTHQCNPLCGRLGLVGVVHPKPNEVAPAKGSPLPGSRFTVAGGGVVVDRGLNHVPLRPYQQFSRPTATVDQMPGSQQPWRLTKFSGNSE